MSSGCQDSLPTTPKSVDGDASSKQRASSEIEEEMSKILNEIKSIDKQLKGLNNRRTHLTAKFEKLNEEKFMKEAEANATEQDWESGNLVEPTFSYHLR